MNILINGLGNIGTTLLNIVMEYKELLKVDKIYALKNVPKTWEENRYVKLKSKGILLIGPADLYRIKDDIAFVFDTTSNGLGTKNRDFYSSIPNLFGAVAQGSELNFGVPYMAGVNDSVIEDNRFITIVSCNTHGILSVIQHYTNNDFNKIHSADFVIVRRSEDIGNHERLVSGNVVARNRSNYGTHHANDAAALLETINIKLDILSSDITTPSQLLHGLRFNLKLKEAVEVESNPSSLISHTEYFDSNRIFEIGRRDSFQGRLYSHSIIVSNNIIKKKDRIVGWAFIPQEGNTLLSTIKAFLIKTCPNDFNHIFHKITEELIIRKI